MIGRRNLSGIDIGNSSVKIVKLRRKRGEVILDEVGYIKLQEGIKLPEEGYKVSESIYGLISTKKMAIDRVVSAISTHSLIIRYLLLPRMPKRDLLEAVKWEIKKQSSLPSEGLICDYIVLEEISKKEGMRFSILAFAVNKSDVQEHINILKEVHLTPVAIDVVPMALLSSFDHNNIWEKGFNYGVVDIGMTKTNLIILKDRMLRFAREIPFGGRDITPHLMDSLGLTKEAETSKLQHEVPLREENDFSLLNVGEEEKTKGILTSLLERLSVELNRSIDYYKAQFREGEISKIFLCGGPAKLRGIDGLLSESLGVPCFIDDPLKNIKVSFKRSKKDEIKSLSPLLTVAVGLALRRVGE